MLDNISLNSSLLKRLFWILHLFISGFCASLLISNSYVLHTFVPHTFVSIVYTIICTQQCCTQYFSTFVLQAFITFEFQIYFKLSPHTRKFSYCNHKMHAICFQLYGQLSRPNFIGNFL